MALKPPIHGRDHCPGGADPIPCLAGTLPWCVRHFEGEWDFSTGYPAGLWEYDWMDISVDPAYFWTNDASVFTVDTDYIIAPTGVYLVTLYVRMHIADYHLDLAPAAGTTRIFPGHCLSHLWIDSNYYEHQESFPWSLEDQALSAQVGGLGEQFLTIAGTVALPDPPTPGFRVGIDSGDSFITGAGAPPSPPSIDGFMQITRLTSTGYP